MPFIFINLLAHLVGMRQHQDPHLLQFPLGLSFSFSASWARGKSASVFCKLPTSLRLKALRGRCQFNSSSQIPMCPHFPQFYVHVVFPTIDFVDLWHLQFPTRQRGNFHKFKKKNCHNCSWPNPYHSLLFYITQRGSVHLTEFSQYTGPHLFFPYY